MRKSLWIILCVLVVTIAAPSARADLYTATFTCTGTCQFMPSVTNNPVFFSPLELVQPQLDVQVDGFIFTFNLASNSLPNDTYSWSDTPFQFPQGLYDFTIGDNTLGYPLEVDWTPPGNPPAFYDGGTLTFQAVATPEPSSVALMLLGIGFVFVARKRIVPGVSRAN